MTPRDVRAIFFPCYFGVIFLALIAAFIFAEYKSRTVEPMLKSRSNALAAGSMFVRNIEGHSYG